MRLLIDTNVFISSEPGGQSQIESGTKLSLDLARVASDGHQLLVHPNVREEIATDSDVNRRALRELVSNRYPMLEDPPAPSPGLLAALNNPKRPSHDWYDAELLAAVARDAVHGLVTEDVGIHKRARRLDVEDRVYTVADAVALVTQQAASQVFVPSVEECPLHAVDLADGFFDSLRADYAGFDVWFQEAARSGRKAFVVRDESGNLAGLCVFKGEDREIGVGRRPGKVSTFKVAGEFRGSRYGELLLKVLFLATHDAYDVLWLTVFEKHFELIDLLERFGFEHLDTANGERRYVKYLKPPTAASGALSALEFHTRFGPPALKLDPEQTFVIPIQPAFHAGLFPDAPGQQIDLFAPRAYGNALRKAYLSHANVRSIEPGATLLFYRSGDLRAITAVGVLEQFKVSQDADEIQALVGSRTVYSADEVIKMTQRGPVLVFLFRQDRFLTPPIRVAELRANGLVARAPQTTIRIDPDGFEWLKARLDA